MKKFLFSLLSLGLFVGVAKADDQRYSPMVIESQGSDYGGYKVSTHAFGAGAAGATGVNYTTASINLDGGYHPGVLVEVYFSTGNPANNDFVEVWDSTSVTFANDSTRIGRFYNTSSYGISLSTSNAGAAPSFKPRQFNKGLIYKPSTNAYNLITVGYYGK